MAGPNSKFDPSSGRRILSDVVKKPKKELPVSYVKKQEIPKDTASFEKRPKPRRKGGFKKFILFLLVVSVGMIAYSVYASKMEVFLVPKAGIFTVDRVVPLSISGVGSDLKFSTISVSVEKEGIFPSGKESAIQERARGTIVVYNRSSREAQTLVATTRFETLGGKVYRIPAKISVPGYTVENGNIVAGSVETEAVADAAGEEYNLGLADFNLPGLKGTPKYEEIYARSKTPMAGGFVGRGRLISQEDVEKAKNSIKSKINDEAQDIIAEKLPGNSFLLISSIVFEETEISAEPRAGSVGDEFKIKISGDVKGIFVDRVAIESVLVSKEIIADYFAGLPAGIDNLGNLEMDSIGYSPGEEQINLRVTGSMEVSAKIDEIAFKNEVISGNLSTAADMVEKFPQVVGAKVKFSPFWLKKVPGNKDRIEISI